MMRFRRRYPECSCKRLPPGAPCLEPEGCECWRDVDESLDISFWLVLIGFFASILLVLIVLTRVFIPQAFAADNDVPCLSKAQAQAKYPGKWLYWHTAQRCWDDQKVRTGQTYISRPATYGKKNSLQLPKPFRDPNGNVLHHSGRPIITEPTQSEGPSIFYPSVIAGGGTSDSMLHPEALGTWPLIVDFDVEPPLFIPWNKRISSMFDSKMVP